MDKSILNNLESVGFNGVLILFFFGVYKFLTSRNFVSRCGKCTADFRSPSTRQKELSNIHEIELKKLDIEEVLAKTELLKYSKKYIKDNSINDESLSEET